MSRTLKIALVAGARPNFMKIAPLIHSLGEAKTAGAAVEYSLIHTGQHYDAAMSQTFFVELGIPNPHVNLEAGGGTQAEQTAAIMVRFERFLETNPHDLVLVVGDVTSTLACSIVAKKMNIKVGHVEGGIRSGDWKMPEEINRIVTDSISDYFFTTSEIAGENLLHEGKAPHQIYFVGNTMIDTLRRQQDQLRPPKIWETLSLTPGRYMVMTLHRPANVDSRAQLTRLVEAIEASAGVWPVIFPVHPRTQKNLEKFGISLKRIHPVEPLGYLEFNFLVRSSGGVITDSGGITEETTVMGIPCITLRDSTERPETVTVGTNELIGTNPDALKPWLARMIAGQWKSGRIPDKWDGHAAERIVDVLLKLQSELTDSK